MCQQTAVLQISQRILSSVPVVYTVNGQVTTVAACVDDAPDVVLTIGLRNAPLPTLVGHLEFVTPAIGPVLAGIVALARVEGSCQVRTRFFQRVLGGAMFTPVLAVAETASGCRRHAQSGRGK